MICIETDVFQEYICLILCVFKNYIELEPYMDSDLNMDTPNIFKSNKFYRNMALHVREEKQLKR